MKTLYQTNLFQYLRELIESFFRNILNRAMLEGSLGLLIFFGTWQLARSIGLLIVLPGPIEVIEGAPTVMAQSDYILSWINSAKRVFSGFVIAVILAIGIGVPMGMSRKFKDFSFPILEVIRPIPLFTGLTIAIAITWEVVIAAEMASGDNGLGFMTWKSYMSHSMVGILVGMLSIGMAGLISSQIVSIVGRKVMPWLKK